MLSNDKITHYSKNRSTFQLAKRFCYAAFATALMVLLIFVDIQYDMNKLSVPTLADNQLEPIRHNVDNIEDKFDEQDRRNMLFGPEKAGEKVLHLNHQACDAASVGFHVPKVVNLKYSWANMISCRNAGEFNYLLNMQVEPAPEVIKSGKTQAAWALIFTTGDYCDAPWEHFDDYKVEGKNKAQWPNYDMQKRAAIGTQQFWATRDQSNWFIGKGKEPRQFSINNFIHTPKIPGEVFCFIIYGEDSYFFRKEFDLQIKYSFETMSTVLANPAPLMPYSKSLRVKGVGLNVAKVGDIQVMSCCRWASSVTATQGSSLNCDLQDVSESGTQAMLTFGGVIQQKTGVLQMALGAGTVKSKTGQLCPSNWIVVASCKQVSFIDMVNDPKWGPIIIGSIGGSVLLLCMCLQQYQKGQMIKSIASAGRR